jgi:hypothetical protein
MPINMSEDYNSPMAEIRHLDGESNKSIGDISLPEIDRPRNITPIFDLEEVIMNEGREAE